MPTAVVQDWIEPETDRSTANYDAITARLGDVPVEGLIVHTAGFTGRGFRIFEVWESREHFDRFLRDRLQPLISEVTGGASDAHPPEMTVYELHSVIVP